MLSKTLYKIAMSLRQAIRMPELGEYEEKYDVPWELITEVQRAIEDVYREQIPGQKLIIHETKHKIKLPSEVLRDQIKVPFLLSWEQAIDNLSQIRRELGVELNNLGVRPENRKANIILHAGLGQRNNPDEFGDPVQQLIFWIHLRLPEFGPTEYYLQQIERIIRDKAKEFTNIETSLITFRRYRMLLSFPLKQKGF